VATRPEHLVTDFEAMFDQMRRHGWSLVDIARETGVARSTLKQYAIYGTTPSHENGERVIAFWCQMFASTREAAPTKRHLPSAAQALRSY
jgi:lambda repressor-like predicted transcriptional regulator